MNKKFLVSYLIFLLLFWGCSEKPISEKQKAINAYKEKQNRQYMRNAQEILLSDISGVPLELFFDSLVISSDGRKVAYVNYDELQDTFYVNINNQSY